MEPSTVHFLRMEIIRLLIPISLTRIRYGKDVYKRQGYVGLVGRVTYDYDNKYLIEGNVGYNGSENFAPGHRYGFFPAVSGGWVLTQEDFLKDNSILNFLKDVYKRQVLFKWIIGNYMKKNKSYGIGLVG